MFNENLEHISAPNKAIIRLNNINYLKEIKYNQIYNKVWYHSLRQK
jgi:hypothetical protein